MHNDESSSSTPERFTRVETSHSCNAFLGRRMAAREVSSLYGLAIAAIITVVNQSVFSDSDSFWRHYSAAVNLFDLCSVVYLCYFSNTGRNFIIGVNNRSKTEKHS